MPREYPRIKLGSVSATLELDDGTYSPGTVLDLSRSGAFLQGCSVPTPRGTVRIRGSQGQVDRQCRVLRTSPGWSAVHFDNPLSHAEMGTIIDGYSKQFETTSPAGYEVAVQDIAGAREEVTSIKECRSNVFLATLGALGAAVVALGGFAMDDKMTSAGLLFGIGVSFFLFLVGVLSTVEKARAINCRQGFLRMLSERVAEKRLPPNYVGWAHLAGAFGECGSRRRLGRCARGLTPGSRETCRDYGEQDAAPVNFVRRLYADMFSSFMSLSSFVYSFVYVVILAAVGYYLSRVLHDLWKLDGRTIGWVFAGGGVASPFLVRWRKVVFLLGAGFVTCLFVTAATENALWGAGLAALSGLLLGALGWFLVCQLNEARRGKHSFDTYYHTWCRFLDTCTPRAAAPGELQPRRTGFFRYVFGMLLSYLLREKPFLRRFFRRRPAPAPDVE